MKTKRNEFDPFIATCLLSLGLLIGFLIFIPLLYGHF